MAEKRPVTFRLWEVLLLILLALVLMVLSTWTDFAPFIPGLVRTVAPELYGTYPVRHLPLVFGYEHLWTFIWWLLLCLFGWAMIKRRSGPLTWGVLTGAVAASVVMVAFCSAEAMRTDDDVGGIGYPVPLYPHVTNLYGPMADKTAFALDFLFWAAVLSAAACVVTFILHAVRRRMRRRDVAAA